KADNRRELLADIVSTAEQQKLAREQERGRLNRFSPAAIAPESLGTVIEAEAYGKSFWKRFLPRWWKLKKQVVSWYSIPNPSASMLQADIAELASYHRRLVTVRQFMAHHSGEISTIGKGEPDWEKTAARIRAVEWLDRAGVQYSFKSAGAGRRAVDQSGLMSAATRLARLSGEVRQKWEELLTEFAVLDPAARLGRPIPDFVTWLNLEAEGCRREAAALGILVRALLPDQDLPFGILRSRAGDVQTLITARKRIINAAGLLHDPRQVEELEEADHGGEADRARGLLEVLEELTCALTAPVVEALTNATIRENISSAVRKSESARRAFDKAWEKVAADIFDPGANVSTNVVMNAMPLADLAKWASERANDGARLGEWAMFVKVEKDVAAFSLGAVLDEIREGEYPASAAADAYRAWFFRLWLDTLQQQVPVLASFVAETHDRLVARFVELDQFVIRTTAERVRGQLLEKPNRPRMREAAPEASELGILLREMNKKRRHLPLRHLFRQIPSILSRLKPCMMMSPLAVSTYLDTPDLTFDIVIFDEASQVRPHDAICAISRGRQLVVGGDPRQLPPTDFFKRTGSEEEKNEAESGTGNFESLLDVCLSLGMPRKRLRWHYRSRREGLIAFSNRYYYDGGLVTFPSADEASGPAVRMELVPGGQYLDGVNVVEARRVAALVMDHARVTPNRTLGVIAFSQRQQERILAEIEVLRRQNAFSESFFSEENDDPFFVKNLENVQGDERDAIL
ncbi:MAG TPA: DEAD/DEAH box helicase, partial [Gemmata sp.]|nr:DEAD/DEAH box helicase [Gemmata sp.]